MSATTCDLSSLHCKPCEGGIPALTAAAAARELRKLDSGWSTNETATAISRNFRFKGFNKTLSFVNAIGWIANRESHHPDLAVGYDYCVVTLTTHAIGGLSQNDFIVAARIDRLLA